MDVRELVRTAIGLGAWALVVAGVWGLGGWPWGLIAAGLPVSGFYLFGEALRLAPRREGS